MNRAISLVGVALCGCGLVTGCAVAPEDVAQAAAPVAAAMVRGQVQGGAQPIVGAHVYLLAAATTGYGAASESLLQATATGNGDALGGYVLTDKNGAFTIDGDYSCVANAQVYLYSQGGDPGAGVNTAASGMAVLGNCPTAGNFAASVPLVRINEVSTVAASYAMAPFAVDATHVGSPANATAQAGIAQAFANAANLVDLPSGATLVNTPAGNGAVPTALINTLADVLVGCVNSTGAGSPSCVTLFANAQSAGSTGTEPGEVASAAINIAHNPGVNVAALYGALPGAVPFVPTVTTQPNDWTIAIQYTGGGIDGAQGIAVDASGDVWTGNYGNASNSVSEVTALGVPLSPATGYVGSGTNGFYQPLGISLDPMGNLWIQTQSEVVKMSSQGSMLSPAGGYTGGGLAQPMGIAVDGDGSAWVANIWPRITEFGSDGTVLCNSYGYNWGGLTDPNAIVIDGIGNAWVGNASGTLSEFNGSNGSPISPNGGGYSGGGLQYPVAMAVDASNNIWSIGGLGTVAEFDTNGNALSPSTGYTPAGLQVSTALAVDGDGHVWVADAYGAVAELAQDGSAISPAGGYQLGNLELPLGVAIDGAGDVWLATSNTVTELVGAAAPVVAPLSKAIQVGKVGARP